MSAAAFRFDRRVSVSHLPGYPIVTRDSVLLSDGRPCYQTFVKDSGTAHVAVVA